LQIEAPRSGQEIPTSQAAVFVDFLPPKSAKEILQGENIYSLDFSAFLSRKGKKKLSKRSFGCDVRGERITSIIAD